MQRRRDRGGTGRTLGGLFYRVPLFQMVGRDRVPGGRDLPVHQQERAESKHWLFPI